MSTSGSSRGSSAISAVVVALLLVAYVECAQRPKPRLSIASKNPDSAEAEAGTTAKYSSSEYSQSVSSIVGSADLANSISINESVVSKLGDLTTELETWEAPYFIRVNFPYYMSGYDEEGRPIWMGEVGKYNLRKVVEEGGESVAMLDKYVLQAAYRVLKSIKEANATGEVEVSEAVFLVDFDGLDLYQMAHLPTLSYTLKVARTYRDLITNILGGTIVVNANYFAESLLNLMRPIFGRAMEKVDIFGTNKSKWVPEVRARFPLRTIPEWYGGMKTFRPVQIYG